MKNRFSLVIFLLCSIQIIGYSTNAQIACDTFIQQNKTLTACDTSAVYFNVLNIIGTDVVLDSNTWIINKQEFVGGEEIEFIGIDSIFLLEFQAIDTSGCAYFGEITIYNAPNFEVIYDDTVKVCKGNVVALKDLIFINGTDSVSYYLFDGLIDENTEFTFIDSSTLEFKLISKEGCVRFISFTAIPVTPVSYSLDIIGTDVNCLPNPNFIVDASIDNLKYNWYSNNGFEAEGDSISVDVAGVYFLIATDSLGCPKTFSDTIGIDLTIPQYDVTFTNILCNEEQGSIIVNHIDSNALVTFITPILDTISLDSILVTEPGIYTFIITGENGCYSSDSVFIDEIITPINYFQDTTICYGDTLFLPRFYEIADSTSWLDGITFDSLVQFTESGVKRLGLYNGGGCTDTIQFMLNFTPFLPDLEFEGEYRFCEGSSDELYVVYDYDLVIWNDTLVSDTFNINEQGFIHVDAFDAFGCKTSKDIFIYEVPAIEVSLLELQHDDCSGNGLIDLAVGGGFPPFTTIWNTGDTILRLDSLEMGQYDLTITDSIGCETNVSYIIDKVYAPLLIPNAHWFVLKRNSIDSEKSEFYAYVIKDEIVNIDNKAYYKVYKQLFHHDFMPFFPNPPYFLKQESFYAYMREDLEERKVYAKLLDKFDLCEDEEEKLWYDFNAVVGDDLADECVYNVNKEVLCDNIEFIDYYNVKRKFYEPGLIEGFGTTYGILDHDAYIFFIPGESKTFIDYCIGDDGDCNIDRTSAVDETYLNNSLLEVRYQNGVPNLFCKEDGILYLYDIRGMEVKSLHVSNEQSVNISNEMLSSGLYIVKLLTSSQKIGVNKIIVH